MGDEVTIRARGWQSDALLWLLGGWFFATFFMMYVAGANFAVLKPEKLPKSEIVYAKIPPAERPLALKYAANELNRHFFQVYNSAQLGLAVLALGLYLSSRRRGPLLLAGLGFCLALTLVFTVYFTPTLVALGREIELMPRDPMPPEVTRFFIIHGINSVLEIVKGLVIAAVSIGLVRSDAPRPGEDF